MKFEVTQKGEWKHSFKLLEYCKTFDVVPILHKYGRRGVRYLEEATPVDTGETANSWHYEVAHENYYYYIRFYNSNVNDGVPIVIILQYGHATRGGTWVEGHDFINPAIEEAFRGFAADLWKEVLR